MPTAHGDKEKAKEDEEAYEKATSTLKRMLNKYEEGKNKYQNLHRMMDARTYPITRSKGDGKEQDKGEGGTKQDDNLQVEEKNEERESLERPDKVVTGTRYWPKAAR